MDANALLRKQGWKGSGHSLDTTGRGIKKPLLIAHKQDQLGLGEKKAAWKTDDHWWMRAFDESLQNIGTGQKSTLTEVREKGINRGGLYGFFVKGEGLEGTITSGESSATEGESTETPASKASTPPTSASETENAADGTQSAATTKKDRKRKRDKEDNAKVGKASKEQERREKLDAAKEQRRLVKEGRLAEKAAAAEAEKNRAAITKKINKLHPQERLQYERKAAKRNMSLEGYTSHRIARKAAKKAAEAKAAKEAAKAASMFVVDLEGDAKLAQDLTSNEPNPLNYTPLEDGSCPLDPTIWDSRSVKSLPKPVREARRKWKGEQRDQRKIRAGKRVEKGAVARREEAERD